MFMSQTACHKGWSQGYSWRTHLSGPVEHVQLYKGVLTLETVAHSTYLSVDLNMHPNRHCGSCALMFACVAARHMGVLRAVHVLCTKSVKEHTHRCVGGPTVTLVLHLIELHVCFTPVCSTFVCFVVHAYENGYPVLVLW